MSQQPSESGASAHEHLHDESSTEQLNLMTSFATDDQATSQFYSVPVNSFQSPTGFAMYTPENSNLLPYAEGNVNSFGGWSEYGHTYPHDNANAEGFQHTVPIYAPLQPVQGSFSASGSDEFHTGTDFCSLQSEPAYGGVHSNLCMPQLSYNSQNPYLTGPPQWLNSTEITPLADRVFVQSAADNTWQFTGPQTRQFQNSDMFDGATTIGSETQNSFWSDAIQPMQPGQSLDLINPVIPFAFRNDSLPAGDDLNQSIFYDNTFQGNLTTAEGQIMSECILDPFEVGVLPPVVTETFPFDCSLERSAEENMGYRPTNDYYPRNRLSGQDDDNSTVLEKSNVLPPNTDCEDTPEAKNPAIIFGPSRKVSLLPARRGGRKGPLSAEKLEKRRQAKKHSVCIRCRKMRIECSGGLPCKACYENSRATLWKYPCAKACFLEIIKHGSIFLGSSHFQAEILEKRNALLTTQQFEAVKFLGKNSRWSRFRVGWPGVWEVHGVLFWDRAAKLIMNFSEYFRKDGQITELPNVMACSNLSIPPLVIHESDPQLVELALLKQRRFYSELLKYDLSGESDLPILDGESFTDFHEYALHLFLWLLQRYEEIRIFRYLQDAADGLNLKSPETRSNLTKVLFHFLIHNFIGKALAIKTFPNGNQKHIQAMSRNYLDRTNQVRSALFVHFRIAVDKLPARCSFWQHIREGTFQIPPEALEKTLASLESFDNHSRKFHLQFHEFCHSVLICPSHVALSRYAHKNTNSNNEEIRGNLSDHSQEILSSPYDYKQDIEDQVAQLMNDHEPRLRFLMSLSKGVMEKKPSFSETMNIFRDLLSEMELIQQKLKDLSEMIDQGGSALKEFSFYIFRTAEIKNIIYKIFADFISLEKQVRAGGIAIPKSV